MKIIQAVIPRTSRGWFAAVAWVALFLFVVLRCQFSLSVETRPRGANGEPSELYFSVYFGAWGTPKYAVGGRPRC